MIVSTPNVEHIVEMLQKDKYMEGGQVLGCDCRIITSNFANHENY
jgi:hypothetical protein